MDVLKMVYRGVGMGRRTIVVGNPIDKELPAEWWRTANVSRIKIQTSVCCTPNIIPTIEVWITITSAWDLGNEVGWQQTGTKTDRREYFKFSSYVVKLQKCRHERRRMVYICGKWKPIVFSTLQRHHGNVRDDVYEEVANGKCLCVNRKEIQT